MKPRRERQVWRRSANRPAGGNAIGGWFPGLPHTVWFASARPDLPLGAGTSAGLDAFPKQKPMRLFTEATLLKMETACTRRPKIWENSMPSFWDAWRLPTLFLKPDETYPCKTYLRVVILSVLVLMLLYGLAIAIALVVATFLIPHFWSVALDPKAHKFIIGALARAGFSLLPLVPLFALIVNATVQWPHYYFWNRRAKRLQREEFVEIPVVAAAVAPNDPSVWPPAPHS